MFDLGVKEYTQIYTLIYFLPVLYIYIKNVSVSGNKYLLERQSYIPILLTIVFLIFWLGFRPAYRFQDSGVYKSIYDLATIRSVDFEWSSEWLWQWVIVACKKVELSSEWYFTVVELGYLGCVFWTCKRLLHENVNLAVLFFLSSFTFLGYGVNTIRNGLACSVVLVAISFLRDGKKSLVIAGVLFLFAFGIHRSTIIPIVSVFVSLFLVKNIKTAILIWITCVVLSLVTHGSFSSWFSGIEFDERFNTYMGTEVREGQFNRTGFRWDFLVYSAVPILTAWFACVRKNIKDPLFLLISKTYIIANAAWVLCIYVAYTDRFAHMSWFMYPLVLAYAFIRLPMFKNQDSVTAWAIFLNAAFTVFMTFIYG